MSSGYIKIWHSGRHQIVAEEKDYKDNQSIIRNGG